MPDTCGCTFTTPHGEDPDERELTYVNKRGKSQTDVGQETQIGLEELVAHRLSNGLKVPLNVAEISKAGGRERAYIPAHDSLHIQEP